MKEKGIGLIVIIILCLTFAMGSICSNKSRKDQNVTILTKSELDRIVKMQEMEDEIDSGAEVFAYKDGDGNLMIGLCYDGDSKK